MLQLHSYPLTKRIYSMQESASLHAINALSCIKYVLFFIFSSLFQQKALSLQPNKDKKIWITI